MSDKAPEIWVNVYHLPDSQLEVDGPYDSEDEALFSRYRNFTCEGTVKLLGRWLPEMEAWRKAQVALQKEAKGVTL